jgi:hypothetical protein
MIKAILEGIAFLFFLAVVIAWVFFMCFAVDSCYYFYFAPGGLNG